MLSFASRKGKPGSKLERATHPLPRPGVPLHHRTKESPQSGCHFLPFCAKAQIAASKTIRHPLRNHFSPAHINYRNLWSLNMKIGCVRSSRLFRLCAHMGAGFCPSSKEKSCRHFHSNVCWSPPILTSKTPGSTTRLLSAPMKDKSSGANSKETFRLSPGCSITFANRLSRFIGGVTLANRSFKYS